TNNEIFYATTTLLGRPFIMAATKQGLCYVDNTEYTFTELTNRFTRYSADVTLIENKAFIKTFNEKVKAYYKGDYKMFDVHLVMNGTNFQIKVWKALQNIPYGQTANNSEIAEAINHPKAVRAVANAIGANPLLIFVPCHRVIGKDGSLTGFRAGIKLKKQLLTIENTL